MNKINYCTSDYLRYLTKAFSQRPGPSECCRWAADQIDNDKRAIRDIVNAINLAGMTTCPCEGCGKIIVLQTTAKTGICLECSQKKVEVVT